MKVLVTGATGFIGGKLAQALAERGDDLRILRRKSSRTLMLEDVPAEHVFGDILDPEAVAKAVEGCELVFHVAGLASYWRAGREQIYRVNVEGTRIVMEACLAAGVRRVVHTSSVAAIGYSTNGRPADENTPFLPECASSAYWDSKRRGEAEVQHAVARGLDAVIVNPTAVIGAGDHNLISGTGIITYAKHSLPIAPPGTACTVDVDAVVAGEILAAERGRTGERYILGGENLTSREMARIVTAVVGKTPPRWTIPAWTLGPAALAVDVFNRFWPRPPVVSGEHLRLFRLNLAYDSSKAIRELGYPMMPFRGAVEKAYRWYKQHGYL